MRTTWLCALVILTACSSAPTAPSTARTLSAPSLAVDMTPPPAPTDLSTSIVSIDGQRVTLAVTWMDNSAYADEWNTCFQFSPAGGGTQCAYASESTPVSGVPGYGSGTGMRTANVIVPRGTWTMVARVTRAIVLNDPLVGDYTIYVKGEWSAPPINVCAKQNC